MKNLKEYLKVEDIEFVRSAETPITIGTRRTILTIVANVHTVPP